MKKLIAVILVLTPILSFSSELPPIEELMSPEEMAETGLCKLSEDERQALREWLEIFVDQDAKFVIKEYAKEQKARRKEEQNRREEAGNFASREQMASRTRQAEEAERSANRFDKSDARIIGEFSGWNGKTQFKLDNGEVWEQRRPDSSRRTKVLMNPEVRLTKNFMGFYVMEVPAARVKVPVTRVR